MKLWIVSGEPVEVVRRAAELSRVGAFRLIAAADRRIRDLYFDTSGGALRRRDLALRLRWSDERLLLTWKGPSVASVRGMAEREEVEAGWSAALEASVLRRLRGLGIDLGEVDPDSGEPPDRLRGVGLVPIQTRSTHRRVRRVLGPSGREVGEMVIDSVSYRLRELEARHHEVEVEAAGPADTESVIAAGEALRGALAPALIPAPMGKLGLGRALDSLAYAELRGLLGTTGDLLPEAYRRLTG